jgi:hypothetical protein
MGKSSKATLARLVAERDRLQGLIVRCQPLWDEHAELKPQIDHFRAMDRADMTWEGIFDATMDLWQAQEINRELDEIMSPADAVLVGEMLDGNYRIGRR